MHTWIGFGRGEGGWSERLARVLDQLPRRGFKGWGCNANANADADADADADGNAKVCGGEEVNWAQDW